LTPHNLKVHLDILFLREINSGGFFFSLFLFAKQIKFQVGADRYFNLKTY